MSEKMQDVGVRIQKYVVAVWWYRGDILSPYGTQFFVFETEKAAIKFARDEDHSLRQRYDFNWLNAGYRFWENHILVTVTDEFGDVKYGWLLFTFSEKEVREICPGKGYDPETVLAERRERSQQKSFVFNTSFIEENK